jgi:YidC/Oxa1 family membrane protein insertase
MREDNKNLLLAIVLSVVVLIGWNYFYGVPQMEKQRQAAQQSAQTAPNGAARTPGAAARPAVPTPSQSGGPAAPLPGTLPSQPGRPVVEPREVALARTPRIKIDTPSLFGSINLRGARIDDVSLKNYRETVERGSPNIVLLSPSGSQNPYYAEFGWVGAGAGPVPTGDTVWTADGQTLTPDRPVTLTWDNGQGLVFRREIAVDAKSMFTVRDSVQNTGAATATLYPYGLVSRHGKPTTLGYYVLHEGLIGALGEQGLQEYTYDNVESEPVIAGGNTRGKTWTGVTGGFVGITDKYWAAAVVPEQNQPFPGQLYGPPGALRQGLSGERAGRGEDAGAGRDRRADPAALRRAPRRSASSTTTRRGSASGIST